MRGNFVVAEGRGGSPSRPISGLRALHCRGERRSPEHGHPAGCPYSRNHHSRDFFRGHQRQFKGVCNTSKPDGKRLNFPPVLFRLNDQLRNLGGRRTLAAPKDQGLHVLFFALKNRRHRPIWKIADPSRDVGSQSFPPGIIAEIHPLDNPFDEQFGSHFGHKDLPVVFPQKFKELFFGKDFYPQGPGFFGFGTGVLAGSR